MCVGQSSRSQEKNVPFSSKSESKIGKTSNSALRAETDIIISLLKSKPKLETVHVNK